MSDVVDLIKNDHRELERLFAVLQSEPSQRPNLVPLLTTLLFAHSRAEESEVYPAAVEAGGAEEVEHSQKEHLEADQLCERLAGTDPESAGFASALSDLADALKHHIGEEEETVLPGMRERLSADALDQLGERFLQARKAHLGDQPEDMTKEQLLQQAQNIDLEGSSSLSKDDLKSALEEQAEE